jgi:hypothetical protein
MRHHAREQQHQKSETLPGGLRSARDLAAKIQPKNNRNVTWTRTAVPAILPILSDQDIIASRSIRLGRRTNRPAFQR